MKIPFFNIQKINKKYITNIKNSFDKVLGSGFCIGGPIVEKFENNFANYVRSKYCAGLSSGLDALILSLRALDIKKGDEVIVPANTYIATWLAVTHVGAKIVPVEPLIDTYNINPNEVINKITKRTKAIIMVHLYGNVCDINKILFIAKKYNLYTIEDAAQAHGLNYLNKKIGSHSDIVAWSFYPTKNLGAIGDAGAVTSNKKKLIDKIKKLRNYGFQNKYTNQYIGSNSRLDPIQAYILDIKLKDLNKNNEIRRKIASNYINKIKNKNITLPTVKNNDTVWHLFVIRTNKRNKLQKYLASNGVETMIHYLKPPHLQPIYKELFKTKRFKITESIHNSCLSLPCNPALSEKEQSYIINVINKFN